MDRHHIRLELFLALVVFAASWTPTQVHAGLGDALKKKIGDKVTRKGEAAADKASGEADSKGSPAAAEGAKSAGSSGAGEKISMVSTKFDYVPGDSVLLLDDFTQDELGEFPARWKLVQGTFETVEFEGERWLRCTSPDGRVRPKLPLAGTLPEFWTLEFDFFGTEPMGSALTVRALDDRDQPVWEAVFPQAQDLAFRSGEIFSSTPLEDSPVPGRHHLMFMARGKSIKAYIDRQRLASVPEVLASAGPVREIEIRLAASTKPLISNVRFAEGGRPP